MNNRLLLVLIFTVMFTSSCSSSRFLVNPADFYANKSDAAKIIVTDTN